MQLSAVRPSHVRTWCFQLAAEGLADSYVYALHARLSQLYADAVHDGPGGEVSVLSAHLSGRWEAASVRRHH